MNKNKIKEKFGYDFYADKYSYIMGINYQFSNHLAKRFKNLNVLETCTGGGFSSISIAKYAKHLYSFDINKKRINDAKKNVRIAGIKSNITFYNDDIYNITNYKIKSKIEAAFIDPDWAVSQENYSYKFINSKTIPPSDKLFNKIFQITPNITLIQPPFIKIEEFNILPEHEREHLYINDTLELYCLHFGDLSKKIGSSEFRIVC